MIRYTLQLFFALIPLLASAKPGDTIQVKAHDETDMTSNGAYDQWAEFPSEGKQFKRVTLNYTMGCASNGCSEWDYTTRVYAMKPTGKIDSTRRQHPLYRVNGRTPDSIALSRSPTFQVRYDSSEQEIDTFQRDTLQVIKYVANGNGVQPSDTLVRWPANYYRYIFDNNNQLVDSQLVEADSTWVNKELTYYETSPNFRKEELARAITPYGGYMKLGRQGFDNSWQRTFRFDVTDFRKLLRDSVKIRVFYDGFSSGFSATINFNFIEGKPNRKIARIYNLYQGDYPYRNPQDFEQNQMPEKSLNIGEDVEEAKIRVIPSGHGFDNDKNCAEFCRKHYKLNVNGEQAIRKLIWRDDCGMNPTFPQGGTWLLNRAGWCPGSRVTVNEHNISSQIQKGENTFDFDLEEINWSGDQRPSYDFAVQLITYKGTRNEKDAALTSIIAPSKKDAHDRINPIAMSPRVEVKNKGNTVINSLNFEYGASGAITNTYQWSGTLEPMERKVITLSRKIYGWRAGKSPFIAKITEVDGEDDGNPRNNEKQTEFEAPDVLPDKFQFRLNTNRQAGQNTLTIVQATGDTIYHKSDFDANANYNKTISLPDLQAEYKLILDDDDPSQSSPRDENGLFYPFLDQAGRGSFNLKEEGQFGSFIKNFNPNFGSRLVYHFATGESGATGEEFFTSQEDKVRKIPGVEIQPNPTGGNLSITTKAEIDEWQVVDQLGRVVHEKSVGSNGRQNIRMNVDHLEPGIYYLKGNKAQQLVTKKFIVQ